MNTQTENPREVKVEIPARIRMMQDAKINSLSLAQMIDPLTQSEISRIEEKLVEIERLVAKVNEVFDEFKTYKEVTLSLATELAILHKTKLCGGRISKNPALIAAATASSFGLSVKQIMSRQRPDSIAIPRMVAMYIMRSVLGMTLESIGEFFKKDHATAMHALNKMKKIFSGQGKQLTLGMTRHVFRQKVKVLEQQFEGATL